MSAGHGKLEIYTEGENGLSNLQFGFRKSRYAVDAIRLVVETEE